MMVTSTDEFFYEAVKTALQQKNMKLNSELEFYLVEILSRFALSDNLYAIDQHGRYKEEPLVLMLKEAEEENNKAAKRLLFRHVGDVALYTSAVFPDSRLSSDYYSFMGQNAYINAAKLYPKGTLANLCRELCSNFGKISLLLKSIPIIRTK